MPRAIDFLRMVAPNARENYVLAFQRGDALLKEHDITTPLRLAHFLAQVLHESGGLTVEWENLSYKTPARLLQIFGQNHSAGVTPSEVPGLLGNPEKLAERVYGLGNPKMAKNLGNEKPGDGFRYRGGGILQTTGRDNYRRLGQKCQVDFEAHPELVVSAEHALKPALAEWSEDKLNDYADADDLLAVSRAINLGNPKSRGTPNGLEDRRRWLAKLKTLIKSVTFVVGEEADVLTVGPPPAKVTAAVKGTGAGLLKRALEHIGERYVFGARPPKDDPQWKGPWDCAEFVSWLVYQEAGILYGCVDDNVEPSEADAYTGGWRTDVERRGIRVSVEKAAATVGGIVLRYPRDGATGHIALCNGKGGTVEAHSTKRGLIQNTVQGRRWDTGVFVPGITYDTVSDMPSVRPPDVIYARNVPNMDHAIIIEIQKALASKGFSPGEIDGDFGPQTEAAVLDFQLSEGLLADGEVGPDTAAELGISLTPAKQPEPVPQPTPKPSPRPEPSPQPGPQPKPIEGFPIPIPPIGIGTMNPFILIAARVFPEILKAVIGDKAGTITGVLTKVITDVTHANTPEEARDKLNADPEAVAKLQLELATIANDYELARRKAELDLIKEQNEQEIKRQQTQLEALKVRYEEDAKKREADFQGFRAGLDDTKDARASLRAMTALAGADKWVLRAPPILSYIVAAGFFAVLTFLLIWGIAPLAQKPDAAQQVVYIVIGALTAALATVVNFWLGSSQSSQRKDAASERQAIHNTEFLERSAKQNADVLEKNAKQAEAQTKAFQSTIATVIEKRAGVAATKASNAIEQCVDIVLKHETDPDLKKLPPDQAREIYRTKYWNVLRCDDLPAGVDLVVFDFGAEAGPAEAAAALQRVVGAEADSSVGPATIAATKAGSPSDIVMRLSQLRRESKRGSSEGMGRISEVEIAAQQMVAAASAVAV